MIYYSFNNLRIVFFFCIKIAFSLKSPCKFMKSMVFLDMVGGIVYG